MSARKPVSLVTRYHMTKEQRAAREAAEASMTPRTQISKTPPAVLKGHKIASATWRRLVSLFNETESTIITAFDEQLLISYCKLVEEELNLEAKVKALDDAQKAALTRAGKIKPTADNLKEWVSMWQQVNGLTANFRSMDARLDGKRKHRLDLEQSLYLTPRSRAGVTPKEKEEPDPIDPMEALLSEPVDPI